MKKNTSQQDLLRTARKLLGANNEELAKMLGKTVSTLNAWLSPDKAARHRTMPPSAKLLLDHVLREHKRK